MDFQKRVHVFKFSSKNTLPNKKTGRFSFEERPVSLNRNLYILTVQTA